MGERSKHSKQVKPWKVFRRVFASVFERYWNYRTALGAAAVIAVMVAIYGYVRFASYQAEHAHEREQATERQIYEVRKSESWLEGAVSSDDQTAAPEARDYGAYYNLKAQQDMAEWTYSVLWISIIGLLASIVGIGFVYANLREMQAQTALNRGVGENQVRAFIHASSATLYVGSSSHNILASVPHLVGIDLKNTGNTPAFAIDGRAKLYVKGLSDKIDEIDMDLDQEGKIDAIAGGSEGRLTFLLSPSEYQVKPRPPQYINALQTGLADPEEQKKARNALLSIFDSKSVVCRGRIQYRDIFGDEFESEFEFTHFGVPSEGNKGMILQSKGLRLFHKIKDRNETPKKDHD